MVDRCVTNGDLQEAVTFAHKIVNEYHNDNYVGYSDVDSIFQGLEKLQLPELFAKYIKKSGRLPIEMTVNMCKTYGWDLFEESILSTAEQSRNVANIIAKIAGSASISTMPPIILTGPEAKICKILAEFLSKYYDYRYA
jgi:hypothetical protein